MGTLPRRAGDLESGTVLYAKPGGHWSLKIEGRSLHPPVPAPRVWAAPATAAVLVAGALSSLTQLGVRCGGRQLPCASRALSLSLSLPAPVCVCARARAHTHTGAGRERERERARDAQGSCLPPHRTPSCVKEESAPATRTAAVAGAAQTRGAGTGGCRLRPSIFKLQCPPGFAYSTVPDSRSPALLGSVPIHARREGSSRERPHTCAQGRLF